MSKYCQKNVMGDDRITHRVSWFTEWEKRVPLIEAQARKLWASGVHTRDTGLLNQSIGRALKEQQGIDLCSTAIGDGIRAIWNHLSDAHKVYRLQPQGQKRAGAKAVEQTPITAKDLGNALVQLPMLSPKEHREPSISAEDLVDALLSKMDVLRLRVHNLEIENQTQSTLLDESANGINQLKDEILRLKQNRSDLTQKLALRVASVINSE